MDIELPTMTCNPGCNKCCGPVPFTRNEMFYAKRKFPFVKFTKIDGHYFAVSAFETFDCPFSSANGCGVYPKRPKICRAFGVVDDPLLKCPEGCGPEFPLSAEQGRQYISGGNQ